MLLAGGKLHRLPPFNLIILIMCYIIGYTCGLVAIQYAVAVMPDEHTHTHTAGCDLFYRCVFIYSI